MQLKKIKLLILGAILITNNCVKSAGYIKEFACSTSYSTYGSVCALMLIGAAAVYANSDRLDDYCESRRYIACDDNQFIIKARTVLHEISYKYRDEMQALDDVDIEGLESLFEQVIHGRRFFGYYSYIEFRMSHMREINLYARKLKKLLTYRPNKMDQNLADLHQALLDRQKKLELLINWVTPERIALYKAAHDIRYSIITAEFKKNIDNPVLLRQTIYEHIMVGHESYLTKEAVGAGFFADYLTQIRASKEDLQKTIDAFLKADKWHTTPLYIKNLLADLDRIEYRILADQDLDMVPNWTTQERFDLHNIANLMLNYNYENELRSYFKETDARNIAKAILKNNKMRPEVQNGILLYADKVQQDSILLQAAVDKYLTANPKLPKPIQTLVRGLEWIYEIATDKMYGFCFYE